MWVFFAQYSRKSLISSLTGGGDGIGVAQECFDGGFGDADLLGGHFNEHFGDVDCQEYG